MIELKKETSRLEDYLEAIYQLSQHKGYASTVDLSEMLQVRPSTVSTMVGNLARKGYLVHEPYRGMKLTEKGEKVAKSVVSRHGIISEFLSLIGIEEVTARQDTEGIEHYIQPITVRKIARLVEFLRKNPKQMKAIRDYIEK
jgi:DtxR family transcriptional regulator, manganese transport regulator